MLPTDIPALLDSHIPGFTLPQPFYTDQAIFDLDMQAIFYQDWLLAIAACEIPEAGDYVTHRVGTASLIIVRGADGEIRCFHNVCRHRGSVLCTSAKGSAPKLVCAYHQWTYELDGRLLFARDMGKDFNASDYGLKPVHCRNAAGIVYICLAQQAPDFEEFAAQSALFLAPHDLANAKVAHESSIVENGNWKLVFENNRECYHCSGNHPALCRTFPEDPAAVGSNANEVSDPQYQQFYKLMESVGAPAKFTMNEAGSWRYVRVPLVGNAESYTMSGKVAVKKPLSTFPFKNAGALLLFSYPTSWNHFLSDHVLLFRLTPLSPMETQVTTKWLVHKDAEEGRDYQLDDLTRVWTETNAEDRRVVEHCQQGVLSPAYEPGPYSTIQEDGVLQFIDWYTTTLRKRLDEPAQPVVAPLLRSFA